MALPLLLTDKLGFSELQELEGDYPCETPDSIQGEVMLDGGVEEEIYGGGEFIIGRL
jgi:hypothetical protein